MNNTASDLDLETESSEARTTRLLAMGQMAASLAHEIRNPLGSMELYCSLLKKDLVHLPEQQDLAEQIHSAIKRVNRIIANCLQFSKDITPRSDAIHSVKGFIEETLGTLEHVLVDESVTISVNARGDRVTNVDHYLIAQVLSNLVANAVEAVRERLQKDSSSVARVLIESIVSDNGWTIRIQDSGVGINATAKNRIFDPFFSTKTSGTGLGLAVVHAIINAHNGTISFDSTEGVGTTVTVYLPEAKIF